LIGIAHGVDAVNDNIANSHASSLIGEVVHRQCVLPVVQTGQRGYFLLILDGLSAAHQNEVSGVVVGHCAHATKQGERECK